MLSWRIRGVRPQLPPQTQGAAGRTAGGCSGCPTAGGGKGLGWRFVLRTFCWGWRSDGKNQTGAPTAVTASAHLMCCSSAADEPQTGRRKECQNTHFSGTLSEVSYSLAFLSLVRPDVIFCSSPSLDRRDSTLSAQQQQLEAQSRNTGTRAMCCRGWSG